MINFPNPKRLVRACVILAAMSVPVPALATFRSYIGPDGGNWSTGGNWSPVGAGIPVNGDDVWISPTAGDRNVTYDVNYVTPGLNSFNLDGQNGSTATLTQNGNTLIVNLQEEYGVNNNGRGRYIQNGGVHTSNNQLILGLTSGTSGTYELSGAAVLNVNANSASTLTVGGQGSGVFTQTGGTHNVSRLEVGARFTGGSGNYSISNGTVNANVILVGDPGSGNFTQTGGNVNAVVLQTGIGGNYNLTDGNLTVTGALINNSNFNESHGVFTGSITNNGSLSLNGGGMIINGAGFNNAAVLNLAGGAITANATITNNGQISFYGNPSIGGSSQFNNLGLITQGAGTLTISAPSFNSGNINLAAGGGIALTGANYTNNGTINLGGGRISGSAQLANRLGATIRGSGLISSPFDNQGGRLLISDGTTLITNAFNNSGIIQLTDDAASLAGGVITNSGEITGHGSISNQITNLSGMIEASGGTLILGGVVNNGAGGILSAPAGGKIFIPGGMSTSGGLINLSGGTFDNNTATLNNTGQISGFGTIRTGGLTNTSTGSMTLTGGFTTVIGNVTNNANSAPLNQMIRIAFNPALFTGNVTNNGIIKTTSTTVTFAGTYTENGKFISDPSDTYFFDVFMTGTWSGGVGDRFFVKGALDWTAGSMVGAGGATFAQGSTNIHDVAVKTLDGWIFNNEKPLTISSGNLNMGNGAIINNTNTFSFTGAVSANITNTLGGTATFINKATLSQNSRSPVPAFGPGVMLLNDGGTVDVASGLDLQGGLSIAAGTTLNKIGNGILRINGPQPHGANATLNTTAGNVWFLSNAGVPATTTTAATHNLTLNINGSGAGTFIDVWLASSQDLNNLNVAFANPGFQSLDLRSPSTAGAFNALRIYVADLASAKTTLWAAIKNANVVGHPIPPEGIYDSGQAAHANTGIGLARLNDVHGDPHIQIRLARIGDLNLDGTVSISDFIDLASNFNSSAPTITWQEGDLNYDGSVTISDFIDLAANFNSSYSADSAAVADFATSIGVNPSVIGSAVPEPGMLTLMGAAALGALGRRRRNSHQRQIIDLENNFNAPYASQTGVGTLV